MCLCVYFTHMQITMGDVPSLPVFFPVPPGKCCGVGRLRVKASGQSLSVPGRINWTVTCQVDHADGRPHLRHYPCCCSPRSAGVVTWSTPE